MIIASASDASGVVRLLDRGVYVEDAQGGYWTLASSAPIRDARGQAIARANLAGRTLNSVHRPVAIAA